MSQSENGSWSCRVSLRITYDKNGQFIREPQVIPFGEVLFQPSDVENILRRAQDALLHMPIVPDFNPEYFLQDRYERAPSDLGFSRNVIKMDVCGPDLVDVTFVDLPGIIANADQVPFLYYRV
jgi:hypothetical protein